MTPPLVVIGGGITGLVAAQTLVRRAPRGTSIVLVDEGDRLGGKIRTHRLDGAAIEAGPDWFLTRGDVLRLLCKDLGIESQIVEPAASGALIWSRDGFVPVPAGFVRGVPASVGGLLASGQLSIAGRLRGLGDLVLSGPLRGPDISVGALVRRRFGHELLGRLVDPIMAASRSGAVDDLSLAAAAPEIDAAARGSRSVMRGLKRVISGPNEGPLFAGLAGGMDTLVRALAEDLGATEVRLGERLVSVEERESGYELGFATGVTLEAAGLVLALPAPVAGKVLEPLDVRLADEIGSIRYAGAAVVSLVYPRGAVVAPRDASGFLVPSDECRLVTACAWYSSKWANARPRDGSFVVRCFAGRSPEDPALRLSEADLVDRVANEFSLATGVQASPRSAFVNRDQHALPVYEVGHLDKVKVIETLVARHPRLALAGASYRGSGLTDCVAGGRAAAERILSH
jgi:oxygen-dependent protoporphyrinogen oxidase